MNNELFSKYQFLVIHIAKRYSCDYLDIEDLIQAGYLGLITGLNKKKELSDNHLINYLSKYIMSEIITTIKSYNYCKYNKEYFKIKRIINENPNKSLNEISLEYGYKIETIIEVFNYSDNLNSSSKTIENKTYLLSVREKEIYSLIVNKNYSVSKLAKLFQVSFSKMKEEVKDIYRLVK